ncbi:hypothetical protein RYH80_07700 [Halobaculum sp. MBLA0147]|uniref:hypothetical protein n=1 Tax=Halobaculum sp. MBLA0147 TaxID=3079934 RepID=UPI0035244330
MESSRTKASTARDHELPESVSADDVGRIQLTFYDDRVADDDAFDQPSDSDRS